MTDPQPYQLQISRTAKRDLSRLDQPIAKRIMNKLFDLASNAETTSHFALSGEWKGLYRIRIGDYRVIYDLNKDKLVILVIAVGHRRNIYKR
jgi:mRNA interferase RelE/StbE